MLQAEKILPISPVIKVRYLMQSYSIDFKKFLPILWILLAVISVAVDYYTGKAYNFPILIAIPIALATWYNGRVFGIITGIIITAGELYVISTWLYTIPYIMITLYLLVRLVLVFSFIFLIDIISRQKKELKILRGFLPICSFCKKIRDDRGSWVQLENYIDDHSEAKFSHSVCPECARQHYGEYIKS